MPTRSASKQRRSTHCWKPKLLARQERIVCSFANISPYWPSEKREGNEPPYSGRAIEATRHLLLPYQPRRGHYIPWPRANYRLSRIRLGYFPSGLKAIHLSVGRGNNPVSCPLWHPRRTIGRGDRRLDRTAHERKGTQDMCHRSPKQPVRDDARFCPEYQYRLGLFPVDQPVRIYR